jgi:hypothetical protein
MVDEPEARSPLDVIGQVVEVIGGLVLAAYMLDQWTNGTVRDVLRSFVEAPVQTIREHLPAPSQVSEVYRAAERITRQAAESAGKEGAA